MSDAITYDLCRASTAQLEAHLRYCDAHFIPPLSTRLKIDAYAVKLAAHAVRLEAWHGEELVGLVAMYCNDMQTRTAYITSVSVANEWARQGIAEQLLGRGAGQASAASMERVALKVAAANHAALSLYRKLGYIEGDLDGDFINMELNLNVRTLHAAATRFQQ